MFKQAPQRGSDHAVECSFKLNVEMVWVGVYLEGLEDRQNVVRRAAALESSHLGGPD